MIYALKCETWANSLSAIAELRKIRQGKAFAAAMVGGVVEKPFAFAHNMISDSLGTAIGAPAVFQSYPAPSQEPICNVAVYWFIEKR
jgi:hypothetical protein